MEKVTKKNIKSLEGRILLTKEGRYHSTLGKFLAVSIDGKTAEYENIENKFVPVIVVSVYREHQTTKNDRPF